MDLQHIRYQVPATTNQLQKLLPHAKIEIIHDYGHICTNGPNDETVRRVLKAVAEMPRLDASRDTQTSKDTPEPGAAITTVTNNNA
mmetsp:Transcript_18566/g.60966  ORF Transcript_18566/g.60966 Transcript_18566/m.60966 type:complete len:86 (-) Transcript_18566:340-597(-)